MNKSWENIPWEFRLAPQWLVAGKDKIPCTVGKDGQIRYASVTNKDDWLTWEVASKVAAEHGVMVGFVLSPDDPYTCIDLDVKDAENCPDKPELWTSPERFDLFYRIMTSFASYTEVSQSGKGLHIWVKGNIGRGARRDGVEVYSQSRFMIFTGVVAMNKPVMDRQDMLDGMIGQMRAKPEVVVTDGEEEEDDWAVLTTAVEAANSDKFCELWLGRWAEMGFPSQSEADMALMSMLTFYSPNNAQCKRLFRQSGLGQREKAVKDDRYLDLTIKTIRQREQREQDIEADAIAQAADLMLRVQRELVQSGVQRMQGGVPAQHSSRIIHPLSLVGTGEPPEREQPTAAVATMAGPVDSRVLDVANEGIDWPPGLAGRIAQFIYLSAPRPVKEVAIVAALGFLAGVCGKAFCVPQSGLNMYIVLVARSAVGKEAMHSGISAIINACVSGAPLINQFVSFDEYVSGPALLKACIAKTSFVNVSGEWGRRMQRMATNENDGPLATLRTQMTNLYQKSGPRSIVGGLGYSNKDNDLSSVSGVAYSMIGETTPTTFYQSLTDSMMEDGFLSRFLIIGYDGERPALNREQILVPDKSLVDSIQSLVNYATGLLGWNAGGNGVCNPLNVARNEEAAKLLSDYEIKCDHNINGTDDESRRQMWNRAGLKALRIAALLAVADNWMAPVIEAIHAKWAIDIVQHNIDMLEMKFRSGDIGTGDIARQNKLIHILEQYITRDPRSRKGIYPELHSAGIITKRYLVNHLNSSPAFAKHRNGLTFAATQSINEAIDNGYLAEVPKNTMVERFKMHAKAYYILKTTD